MSDRPWPALTLKHLRRLTDDCGIIQHAKFWVPNYASGYCIDDNSRALIVACRHYRLYGDELSQELMCRYLAFILYMTRHDGKVRNFLDYRRNHLEDVGSPDSLGRTLWGLGHLATADDPHLAVPARETFHHALPHLAPGVAPHTLAYGILGLCAYAQRDELRPEARRLLPPLADSLYARYQHARSPSWEWVMPILTYDNGRLPHALLLAGALLERRELCDAGLRTLDFLNGICFREAVCNLVGSNGWFPHDGECARYDQQPIDAGSLVEVNLAAYHLTGEARYLDYGTRAMDWFYGGNLHGIALYHPHTGGCMDGLNALGVNANQGAESTLAYLMAHLALAETAPRCFHATNRR